MRPNPLLALLLATSLPLTALAQPDREIVDPALLLGDEVLQLCESEDAQAMAECLVAQTTEEEREAIDTAVQRGMAQLARAYYLDVAEQLIRSGQPRSLLLAARLLRYDHLRDAQHAPVDADSEASNQRVAELARAAAARAGDDRVMLWTLANNVFRKEAPELAAVAISRLQTTEPENFAVWRLGDDVGPWGLAKLTNAAQARYSDILYNERMRADVELLSAYEIPAELKALLVEQAAPDQQLSDHAIHSVWSSGALMAEAIPASQGLTQSCGPGQSSWREEHLVPCQRIAQVLATASDNLLDTGLGLSLQARLARNGAQRQSAQQARRRYEYQREVYGEWTQTLKLDAMTDLLMTPGATEISLMSEYLHRSGLPLDPPADWLSAQERYERERMAKPDAPTSPPSR